MSIEKGNQLAHSLAQMALDEESKVVWIEEVPPSLSELVVEDAFTLHLS